jgi:MFS family permease
MEPDDEPAKSHPDWRLRLWDAWTLVRDDRHFRRLLLVAMLFVTAQFIFPHYQALGRLATTAALGPAEAAAGMGGAAARGEAGGGLGFQMMLWIVVQNLGVGLFSFVFGHLADWYGNRLVLRIVIFGAALTPLAALALAFGWLGPPERWFWLTFALLGLLPVGLRTVQNYTLELCPPTDHPRYVSTVSLGQALPLCLSPVIGLVMDYFSFPAVFCLVAGLIAIGGLLTLDMIEPREDLWIAKGEKIDSYVPDEGTES